MIYVLENKNEFNRLEKQSNLPAYDYVEELSQLDLQPGEHLLDAGSGSGIVSNYLAEQQPSAHIIGCDLSLERITQATEKYGHQKNLQFIQADLLNLELPQEYDRILCRYTLSHLGKQTTTKILKSFYQTLQPGGTLYLVDVDGLFVNLFPQSHFLSECLVKLGREESPDYYFARALPWLTDQAGFENLQWHILTKSFDQDTMPSEITMIESRFHNAKAYFETLLESKETADRFLEEYLATLSQPGTVLFYNKFVVKAQKPK